jgi:ELWxxDGT repeat protein
LWKSDGTSDGTVMVKDLNPYGGSNPTSITVAGDKLYFAADRPDHQRTLWVTDGSESGTQPLHERIRNSGLVSFQDQLYYWTRSYVSGADDGELWRTDGTVSGIEKITDALVPYYVIAADSLFYFFPDEGKAQPKLWRSDGTAAGTYSLDAPLFPYSDTWYFPDQTLVLGDHLFFVRNDGESGTEPWISDGTVTGTRMLADIVPGPESSFSGNFQILGDKVYFRAQSSEYHSALWKTDGTSAGTQQAASIFYQNVHRAEPEHLTVVGNKIFFSADDGVHGRELWTSDGTEEGSYLVKDINPGSEDSLGNPGGAALGDALIFVSDNGQEVWKSNGTEAGTIKLWETADVGMNSVESIWAAQSLVYFYDRYDDFWVWDGGTGQPVLLQDFDGFPTKQVIHGDRLYLGVYEWDDSTISAVESLWTSTGTPAGTIQLYAGPLTGFCVSDGTAYFTSEDEIWRSDGTVAGTNKIVTIDGAKITDIAASDGHLFITDEKDGEWSLWRSDGTQSGTEMVRKVIINSDDGTLLLYPFKSGVVFAARDDAHGREPWISDGTPKGTMPLSDIATGEESSYPDWITPTENLVFFAANDSIHGVELWASDGTAQGTFMVEDIVPPGEGGLHYCPGDGSCPGYLTVAGKRLYFAAEEGDGDVELWALNLDE